MLGPIPGPPEFGGGTNIVAAFAADDPIGGGLDGGWRGALYGAAIGTLEGADDGAPERGGVAAAA